MPGLIVRQRRFAHAQERDAAIQDVLARDLDPSGREATGWYYADCFRTGPADAAASYPIDQIVAGRSA